MKFLKKLAVVFVLWRMFGPELRPSFEPNQIHPMQIPGRTVFVSGREVFIREAGPKDGTPIVLVHGWGDASNVIYSRIMPALAQVFRVIAVDNRDAGKSDAVRSSYQIADAADDLAGVLDTLGLDSVAVFGYSMGGMIVQELAYRRPDLVGKIGLGGTAAHVSIGGSVGNLMGALAFYVARGFERVTRSEVSYVRTKYLERVGAITPNEAQHFWLQSIGRDPESYWAAGFAARLFDSRDWVGSIRAPALVVVNTNDQLVPTRAQYDLASRIDGAVVLELVGARHESPLTHHAEMVAAISKWVRA